MTEQRIIPQVIEEEMKRSYLDYAMSVIVGRALPDARDGLKPVHRRILYAMGDMGMRYNTPYKKCARIVGEVLGKYHPHGDSAVYETLVRMAQEFSLRYPLIDGQGNFGSVDGDNAAAMRYTEARLARIADEILQDIDKETVEFVENFDGSLTEPSVLPAKLPNLLINGSAGIAVGMATNIPPHNLREVCDAAIALIKNPDITVPELMEHITGPDFPTGAIITGRHGLYQAYTTGRGSIRIRSVIEHEEHNGKQRLIITAIPYQVGKGVLIEQIADAVNAKRVEGVSDLRDESDRRGMRVVIELKRDASPELVERQLLAHTRLQVSYGINMVALVDGKPRTLGLKQLLEEYVKHRRSIVRRRTAYELAKAEQRAHVLEGLTKALNEIDAVIALIKGSPNVDAARAGLIERHALTPVQANAILDMRLQKLAALEQRKIRDELEELRARISDYQAILADEQRILSIITEELEALKDTYGDERRTQLIDIDEELDVEALIAEEEQVVTVSHAGYAKRMSLALYKEQRRGGTGVRGATTKEDDFIEHLFVANTHDYLLFFTDKGKVYWKKVYQIPEAGRQSKGRPLINLIRLEQGERISALIPIKTFSEEQFLVFFTRRGLVKRTPLSAYSRPRQGGIIAMRLNEGDSLVNVLLTTGASQLLIASAKGQAVKFNEEDVRPMGRVSAGVRGIRLRDDFVVGAIHAPDDKTILTITENGFGKRSLIRDYRLINRGGVGVRNIICSPRNGRVVSVKAVTDDDHLMLSTTRGTLIRIPARDIRVIGRNTQGVRIMRLRAGDRVAACARILGEPEEEAARAAEN
ncbi:DNA gyrase subunit A [Candidatus Woesearchaeota archaeon]|nr:MAG: DNA gyrase subunit A [Candidatus Woesearchaeota archaeon]